MFAGKRLIVAVAISAIAIDTALLGMIAPLLPEVERRTGAGEAELGLALAAYAIAILLVSIPMGRATDRVGRKPLLISGLVLTAFGSILIAVSDSLGPLFVGRAIQGVGSAASWVAALALVSDIAPAHRKGEAIGFALAANSAGSIAGPALGGLVGGALGFGAPFLMVAGVGLVIAAAGARWLPAEQVSDVSSGEVPAWRLLAGIGSRPSLRPALAIAVGGAAALGLIEVVVPLDLDERLGFTAETIGLLFAATVALDAIAAPISGRIGDRIGRRPVAAVGLLLIGVSVVPLVLIDNVAGPLIALSLFGVGLSACFAAAVPWLDDAFGDLNKGLAYGGLNILYSAGYAIGPVAAGLLLEIEGPTLAYLVLGVPALLGGFWLLLRRDPVRAA